MRHLIIVMLMAAFFSACDKKEQAKPQYQFPTETVQSQDTEKLLREALSKDPKNLNALINLGNLLMDSNRFAEAVDAYQKALDIDPKNVNVRVDMGTCLRNSGNPQRAMQEYRKAIEIEPNHVNAHKNMGVVLAYDFKDSAQAIKEFEKVLQIAPNDPDAGAVRQEIQKLKSVK